MSSVSVNDLESSREESDFISRQCVSIGFDCIVVGEPVGNVCVVTERLSSRWRVDSVERRRMSAAAWDVSGRELMVPQSDQ